MEFIIKDAVPNGKTPDSFEVVIHTMRGDADGYEDVVVGPFIRSQDEASLEFLLEVLTELAAAYPNGMSGRDRYTHIKNFETWFGGSFYDNEEDYIKYEKSPMPYAEYLAAHLAVGELYAEWPYDYDQPNSYESHKIFYYDEALVQHNVEVAE